MTRDRVHGQLDLLLLAIVEAEPIHGYGICEELRRRSRGDFDLREGTVYPALHRLEAEGLLESNWGDQEGRRRRLYRLTRRGRTALGQRTTQWRQFTNTVDAVLGGGPWPAPA